MQQVLGRRQWHPTPMFWPGESQGQRSLVGCHLWGGTESDMTEVTQQQQEQVLELGCYITTLSIRVFHFIPHDKQLLFCTECDAGLLRSNIQHSCFSFQQFLPTVSLLPHTQSTLAIRCQACRVSNQIPTFPHQISCFRQDLHTLPLWVRS